MARPRPRPSAPIADILFPGKVGAPIADILFPGKVGAPETRPRGASRHLAPWLRYQLAGVSRHLAQDINWQGFPGTWKPLPIDIWRPGWHRAPGLVRQSKRRGVYAERPRGPLGAEASPGPPRLASRHLAPWLSFVRRPEKERFFKGIL